jgi:hypothetical protein
MAGQSENELVHRGLRTVRTGGKKAGPAFKKLQLKSKSDLVNMRVVFFSFILEIIIHES